jgi:hypothetical protein
MTKKIFFLVVTAVFMLSSCNEESVENTPKPEVNLFINEVYSGDDPSWVELYNNSSSEANIAGFVIRGNKEAGKEYIIPNGVKIAAKSFLLIDDFTFDIGSVNGFVVTLFDSNMLQIDQLTVPVLQNGQSYGRKTDGGKESMIFDLSTKGRSNTEKGDIPSGKNALKLFINEVVSAPASWGVDFIEIYNDEDRIVDIGGFVLQDDKGETGQFVIPQGVTIPAKGFIVFEQDTDFSFGLGAGGDKVVFWEAGGKLIDEIITPDFGTDKGKAYARTVDGGSEWKIFDLPTKGRSNIEKGDLPPENSTLKLFINEVVSAPSSSGVDFIEIYNDENRIVDISGFVLQDDKGEAEQFVIPQGVSIPAKGFIVFEQGAAFGFGLSSSGDVVIFLEADGKLIDEITTPDFGTEKGKSYARTADGGSEWKIFDLPTKGHGNTEAGDIEVPPGNSTLKLYINEISTNGANKADDWVEFYNGEEVPVDMTGYKLYDDGGLGKAFTFPKGATIAPGSYLICTEAAFHFGLAKGGDKLTLLNSEGEQVDHVDIPALGENETYGRSSDGADTWTVFTISSMESSNSNGTVKP